MSSIEELQKLKLNDLKKLCLDMGLPETGKKADLISRLLISGQTEVASVSVAPEEEAALLGDDTSPVKIQLSPAQKHAAEPLTQEPSKKIRHDESLDDSVEDDVNVVTLTEEERKAKRAVRFNDGMNPISLSVAMSDDKIVARAKRFGLPISDNGDSAHNTKNIIINEKKKMRAERFGIQCPLPNPSYQSIDSDISAKLEARIKRFGIPAGTTAASSPDEVKKMQRAERFKA